MIRVGIGGWTYEPWRGTFYPGDLTQKRELHYASRHVTTIEVNGTFYRTQKPDTFKAWADEAPDGFVFALKAPRYAVNRRKLAEGKESIDRFFESGVSELGEKLGPILWQFAASKVFDEDDFTTFLEMLPHEVGGRPLRHAVEPRHDSFRDPAFVALARRFSVATVLADSDDYPQIADMTGDFLYARLQRAEEAQATGYPPAALDLWADRLRLWEKGGVPKDMPLVAAPADKAPRDCFVYMINGAKVRAPAAAMALLDRLGGRPSGN